MDKFPRFTLAIPLLLALVGCGAKGPLILPEKAAPIAVPVPADAPNDNTPQIEEPASTPSPDEQAEDAVEDPATPAGG